MVSLFSYSRNLISSFALRFLGLERTHLDKLELAVAGIDGVSVLTWVGLELAAVDGDGK